MKRSRLGQIGSLGSKRRNCCHRQYTTGARAIGVPGCPELAAWTASMESVRMVLMHSWSIAVASTWVLINVLLSPVELQKSCLSNLSILYNRALISGILSSFWPTFQYYCRERRQG